MDLLLSSGAKTREMAGRERERATFLVLVLLKILRVTGKKNLAFPAYYSYSSSSGCCWDKRSITDFFWDFLKKSVV